MTKRRTFSKEFKEQIVQLHAAGKPRSEIIKEYDLSPLPLIHGFASISQRVPSKQKIIVLQNKKS